MNTKKEKTHDQKVRAEALKKLGLIVIGLLFIVNTVQLSRLGAVVERVDQYNKGVVDEIGGVRQDIVSFASDLNEIRQFLLLPAKQYSFGTNSEQAGEPAESVSSRTETAIFSFLEEETSAQNYQKNSRLAEDQAKSLLADTAFNDELAAAGLKNMPFETNESAASFKISDQSGTPLFAVIFDKKHNQAKIQSVLGAKELKSTQIKELAQEISVYSLENKQKVTDLKNLINKQKESVSTLVKNQNVSTILNSQKLTFSSTPSETDDSINYTFTNKDQESLIIIQISRKDGQFTLLNTQTNQTKNYSEISTMLPDLADQLKNLDTASAEERLLNQRKAELQKIFNQDSFKDLLKNNGLTLVSTPREEANKIVYDVKNAENKVIFSFAIEKSSGLFKVIKENTEIDLYSTISGDGSKKKT